MMSYTATQSSSPECVKAKVKKNMPERPYPRTSLAPFHGLWCGFEYLKRVNWKGVKCSFKRKNVGFTSQGRLSHPAGVQKG